MHLASEHELALQQRCVAQRIIKLVTFTIGLDCIEGASSIVHTNQQMEAAA